MAKENGTPAKPASTDAAAAPKPKQVRKPKKTGPTPEELEAAQGKLETAFTQISDAMRVAADAVDSYKKMILNSKDLAAKTGPLTADEKKADLKRKRAETKANKDPNAPRRPTTGFLDYQNEVREKFKQDHPDLPNSDRLKLIAEAWKTMEPTHKAVYSDRAKAAMQEWKIETAKYKGEIPAEGTSSATEPQADAEDESEGEEEEAESDAASEDGSTESGSDGETSSEDEAPKAASPVPVKKTKPTSSAATSAAKPKGTPKAKDAPTPASNTPVSAKKSKKDKDTKPASQPAEKKQKTKK